MSDKKFLIAEILDDIRNSLLSGVPIEASIADIMSVVNTGWDKKEKPIKGTSNFTRPANATPYTALDAITNGAIMTIDLSSYGVVAGDIIAITNVRVLETTKLSGAAVNVIILPSTFTFTADNAELALSDAENQLGGIVVPCLNLYTFLNNSRMVSEPGLWLMEMNSTNIYVELQAASNFTPGNASRWDVILEGVILK